MNEIPELAELLKSTSRSFYLSLEMLPLSMRPTAGLGYLLCRTADTIADEKNIPYSQKLRILNQFYDLLDRFPVSMNEWDEFTAQITSSLQDSTQIENQLLPRIPEMIQYLSSFPKTDQSLIQQVVQSVIQGMRIDLKTFGEDSGTLTAFKTRSELERYLTWIGGEPGRFWSELTLAHQPNLSIENPEKWISNGVRFGTGLQMINVLRDLAEDLRNGRCYLPLEDLNTQKITPDMLLRPETSAHYLPLFHRLIDDTLDRLQSGLTYIHSIPRWKISLRLAAWLPLAIGLKTLKKMRLEFDILNPEKRVKISRRAIFIISTLSTVMILWNGALSRYFRQEKLKIES